MPERVPSFPPGASAQEVLTSLLPLVVQAASDSAAAATAVANSSAAVEQRLESFQSSLDRNTEALNRLNTLWEKQQADAKERNAWLRQLITPQTLFWLIALAAAAIGVRLTIPAPLEVPGYPPGVLSEHKTSPP